MKELFNTGWEFAKYPLEQYPLDDFTMDTVFNETNWTQVDLPHDWMIYDSTNLYEQAISCYRKKFVKPDTTDSHIFLRFEGVYMDTTIYLNGKEFFQWKYGYSTFDLDLSTALFDGENELLVKNVYQLPNSRWYPGSGIYRNVYLITKPDAYLPLDGSYISTKRLGDTWEIFADLEYNLPDKMAVTITHEISDENGDIVAAHSQDIDGTQGLSVDKQLLTLLNPRLWDITDPYLYHITSTLMIGGDVVDSITQNLGFRYFEFDCNKGFYLNGRHVKIHGACLHHDLGSLGAAVNKNAIRRQFESMQKMGVNSIRTAHNMPAVEVMELADEMGILIYSESFDMWERTKTDYDYGNYFKEWWKKDLTSWVRRDRNHPSLIIWGIGNEIFDTHFERGKEITVELRDAVYELDYRHNGVTGLGSNFIATKEAQDCSNEVDIMGYNYSEHLYEEHHKLYPHWNIFGSETSSTVQSRGIYHFPATNRLLTYDDGQCSCLGNCTTNWGAKDSMYAIAADRDHEFCFGQYIWSGWDYIGEPTPYFTKNSYFGQVDTAGFEKDTYYVYQAEWTNYKENPMIHLLPYWDFNEGQLIDIRAYTNAPKSELFFNDKSLGTFHHDHAHGNEASGTWQIPYQKGVLKAVAYDENDNIIATDIQQSFGDPVSLELNASQDTICANGTDLIFITITTKDKDGIYVANSRSRVNVTVSGAGRLIGLDNGDSSDFDQYKGTSRKLFSGKLLAIIAAKDEPGEIVMEVTSPGMPPATMTFTSTPGEIPVGTSCLMENTPSDANDEIPVRMIALQCDGSHHLGADNTTTTVTATIHPANATYDFNDLTFKALTLDGVESNCVKITKEGDHAMVEARGDGKFRLSCSCNNGLDHPEVLSELEFDITGMGQATLDPYNFVSAIQNFESTSPLSLSFQGGVYITTNERTYVAFDNVDFGDYGSDEIHLPIFSFDNQLPIEVWEGIPEKGGKMLLRGDYEAKSWYNHYQENVYKLPKRLKGTQIISIVVEPKIKMSLKGFSFTHYEKAYSQVEALENTRITGDMFHICDTAIEEIGNNVTLEFENMNFSEGFSQITICGRAHNETNSIHIHVINESGDVNQIIDFPASENYQALTFPLDSVPGNGKVNFIFMPGSKFDFKYFRFQK